MGYLIGWLIIGLILVFIMDKAIIGFKLEISLSNSERVFIAILWPLATIIFLITFIRELFR
jgi:hypothetical protein